MIRAHLLFSGSRARLAVSSGASLPLARPTLRLPVCSTALPVRRVNLVLQELFAAQSGVR